MDNQSYINKVKEGMDYIDLFDNVIIGSISLHEGISLSDAVAGGAKLKEGSND